MINFKVARGDGSEGVQDLFVTTNLATLATAPRATTDDLLGERPDPGAAVAGRGDRAAGR